MKGEIDRQPDRALQLGNTAIQVFIRPLNEDERRQRDEQTGRIARRILLGHQKTKSVEELSI